jgi:hypothetical protein
MISVLAQLVPMILGAMLAPVWVIIVLLLLAGPGGRAKAAAFLLGITTTRLVQGAIFGALVARSPYAEADASGKSPFVATLLLVVGILLLVAAYRKWRKEEDPDEPPPKWMQSLDGMTPLKAFGLGAGLIGIAVKLWVFTLSALGVIRAAELSLGASVGAYLLYVLLAQLLLIVPIVASLVAPAGSAALLKGATGWLTRNNRPISIAVALIFGLYFTYDGVTALLG